jgi:diadenosine tetraphosphate (Ap4A) HIT family hydrolase
LILKQHYDHFHQVPGSLFHAFNREMRLLEEALRLELSPDRVNYAVLGNIVSHVHWHLIPRYQQDDNWGLPPWPVNEIQKLAVAHYDEMAERIRDAIRRSPKPKPLVVSGKSEWQPLPKPCREPP